MTGLSIKLMGLSNIVYIKPKYNQPIYYCYKLLQYTITLNLFFSFPIMNDFEKTRTVSVLFEEMNITFIS